MAKQCGNLADGFEFHPVKIPPFPKERCSLPLPMSMQVRLGAFNS